MRLTRVHKKRHYLEILAKVSGNQSPPPPRPSPPSPPDTQAFKAAWKSTLVKCFAKN